jgi:hypothetical protein
VPVLPTETEQVLGYAPRADVLLEKLDGSRRLWIEFEVSRADPVANHAKFATSHLFQPMPTGWAFVSMVSPHVHRGRRNLGAATVHLMRHIGIESYQTMLLPELGPEQVKMLNHLDPHALQARRLRVDLEIERALAVSHPLFLAGEVQVHLCGELLDVLLSLRRWNADIATDAGRQDWGRRTVTYFVHDPTSQAFAPSKFCAYLPVVLPAVVAHPRDLQADREMSIGMYTRIELTAPRFDGGVAWKHLTRNLAMMMVRPEHRPDVYERFSQWLDRHREQIDVHPSGPVFLLPPQWFR